MLRVKAIIGVIQWKYNTMNMFYIVSMETMSLGKQLYLFVVYFSGNFGT